MTHTWEQLEGVSLAGEYDLGQWLGSDSSGAFFLTSFGPERERAVVKLMVGVGSAAAAQLALWQRTAHLKHPSLMALLDCGCTDYGDDSFLYAVFEAPDDSLTAAVQNGALSEDEARDVLVAALDALEYLHSCGFAHSSIDTEHIVAVGDKIKLASDTLQGLNDNPSAASDDVWALGALLYELLTTRRIRPGEVADVSQISDPLRTVIEHAAEPEARYRWSLEQIAEVLHPGQAHQFEEAVVPLAADAGSPATEEGLIEHEPARAEFAAPRAEEENEPRPSPVVVHEPFSKFAPGQDSEEAQRPAGPSIARYVPMAAVAAVALLAIIFVMVHHATPTPIAVAIVPPPVAEPVAQPVPVSVPKSAANSPKPSQQSWRVIAYTFARSKDAEKKAESINAKFPGIHAAVFAPRSRASVYLISLGAHLTRDEAAALQRKAIGKGMPRDTYIQNFSE